MAAGIDPWLIELNVVRGAHGGTERSALSRDVARGLLLRLRRGVYVERLAFEAMSLESQHLVRMRALAAVSAAPVVFSHVSAAILHRLPVNERCAGQVHVTLADQRHRGLDGVVGHVLPLAAEEVQAVGGLLVTTPVRTVADLARALPFEEGVMAADAALRRGLDRLALEAAVEEAPDRKGATRALDVVGFAHPGAESAAESRSRCTMLRLGLEPPVLQHRLVLADGSEVFLDGVFPTTEVGFEVDGAVKLLDPVIAPDARRALWKEKRREDAVRLLIRGLARWGWPESGSGTRLAAILALVGVRASTPPAVLADYIAAARDARPRRAAADLSS